MRATRAEIYAAKTKAQLEALRIKYNYGLGWPNMVLAGRERKRKGNYEVY